MTTEKNPSENFPNRVIEANEAHVIWVTPEARKVVEDLARGSR